MCTHFLRFVQKLENYTGKQNSTEMFSIFTTWEKLHGYVFIMTADFTWLFFFSTIILPSCVSNSPWSTKQRTCKEITIEPPYEKNDNLGFQPGTTNRPIQSDFEFKNRLYYL